MPENPGNLLDDGQPQAQAAILVRALFFATLELLEDFLQAFGGDTHAAVPDLDRQPAPLAPTAQHHPALAGVADGVAQQVAQNPRQQLDVAAHQRRASHEVQFQAFAAGHLGVLGGEVFQQFAQGKGRDIGLDHPGIELGNVHQGAQQVFHVFQGVADIAHQGAAGLGIAALQQGAGEQPRGVQGLQQVMADRGEELGLRQVGPFGLGLGLAQPRFNPAALFDFAQQLLVEGGQFGGAFAHPQLQVLVGLMQRLGGTPALGDVADQHEDPHHLAIGQAVGHVGAQHVALLIVDVGLGEFEGHALPGQGPFHIAFQALVVLLAVHLAQALAEHHAAGPAVPFLVDLVGELVHQVGIEVGDQRRHMVGDQADPAFAFAQGLGVLVALGDVGEGVDETTGGQRMGADLQHPAIAQALLAFVDRPAVGVAAVGAQQAQFAVADDLGKQAMRGHRGQPAELQEAPVPQLQHALGADHGHALGQVVHRPLQQVGLLRHRLFPAQGFAVLDLGDVSEQDHPPAFPGRPLADLQPAAVMQAIQQLLVTATARFFAEQPGAGQQPAHFREAHAGHDPYPACGSRRHGSGC